MEVILNEKVENLGNLGDRVRVRPGYARNFLLPKGRAVRATAENIERFEARRAELEKIAADKLAEAERRRDALQEVSVTLPAKAGEDGKLYGSVGTADIAAALTEAGQPVEKQEIRLPEGPFRLVGEYTVQLHLHTDVDAEVTVVVTPAE